MRLSILGVVALLATSVTAASTAHKTTSVAHKTSSSHKSSSTPHSTPTPSKGSVKKVSTSTKKSSTKKSTSTKKSSSTKNAASTKKSTSTKKTSSTKKTTSTKKSTSTTKKTTSTKSSSTKSPSGTSSTSVSGRIDQNAKWLSGVAAMHSIVVNARKVILIDKAEENPAHDDSGEYMWAAEYDIVVNEYRGLTLTTDTFCSAGAFVPNGTFYSTGGGQKMSVGSWNASAGFETIRQFVPCNGNSFQSSFCEFKEYIVKGSGLKSNRWYPTAAQLPTGEIIIVGGSIKSSGVNTEAISNPTYEFWPPRSNKPTTFAFLQNTLPYNLYPFVHVLANGNLYVFANRQSIEWNYNNNSVIRTFQDIPGNPRSYPLTGGSVLLPISAANNYGASVMVCGGGAAINPQAATDNTCGVLDLSQTKPTWKMSTMPTRRVMPDMLLLPDGNVWIGNGAQLGSAGYDYKGSNGSRLQQAYNPSYQPTIYNVAKSTFTTNLATSKIARMYHSVANLLPDGRIFIAGSNPNSPERTNAIYPTEYRVEYFLPPYFFSTTAPAIVTAITTVPIGKSFSLEINLSGVAANNVQVALINGGFTTHSIHMSQRLVYLQFTTSDHVTLTVQGPPNTNVYPAGPGMLFVINNGVPSVSSWVLVN